MQDASDANNRSTTSHGGHRRLGIVGGGQLASMTAAAARQLGCDVLVLERQAFSPASHAAGEAMVGDWNDVNVLTRFAAGVDVVTLENEFVSADALAAIEAGGAKVWPSPQTLRLVQDKLTQKQTLAAAGLAVTPFAAVASVAELREALIRFGMPAVLKARRNGYDGKGNVTIRTGDDIEPAWQKLGGGATPLYVEAFCPFEREVATIVTRGTDGRVVVYPVVETIQENHICRVVRAPAETTEDVKRRAAELAVSAIVAIGGVGSFGVEMFLTGDGSIFINELAPRVHNSGHYTIEGCVCSQFENHVRAVMGWPLGDTAMTAPAAVMVNLLGTSRGPGEPRGLSDALAVPGAHVHVYGKSMSGAGRKMGHVTATGATLLEASDAATRAAAAITFGSEP
jgi:5-(carboxyamino)imidazole ribonucleotide synthase